VGPAALHLKDDRMTGPAEPSPSGIAHCGNDCGRCPRHLATREGGREKLRAVAALWLRIGWRDREPEPEEMACYGCGSTVWCRYGIKPCAESRHAVACGECADFPCGLIRTAFEKTEEYREQCRRVCSAGEYADLEAAFFRKRENLKKME
jgi:hypothetical protein